ncbi:MAG: serine/threonine protein kinase [Myxococcales bacterium]|nr:serine/threonine protein kinase [Myxococcales bacterium]
MAAKCSEAQDACALGLGHRLELRDAIAALCVVLRGPKADAALPARRMARVPERAVEALCAGTATALDALGVEVLAVGRVEQRVRTRAERDECEVVSAAVVEYLQLRPLWCDVDRVGVRLRSCRRAGRGCARVCQRDRRRSLRSRGSRHRGCGAPTKAGDESKGNCAGPGRATHGREGRTVTANGQPAIGPGAIIGGTWQVTELLGKGGMGAVWAARHVRLKDKLAAIKVLLASGANTEQLARFQREAEIAARIGHPNIVDVYDMNALASGEPYIVLELLDGESLRQRIARGPVPLDTVCDLVRQIGSALYAAHRMGVVHRDLKPENVFLVPTDSGGVLREHVKVLDFGISKLRGSQTVQTQESTVLGTPQYMAPEQAAGRNQEVDARTDVFALGTIVYEMLCGAPPFMADTPLGVMFKVVYEATPPLALRLPAAPAHVIAAVERALQKQADARWPDVAAFVEALTGQPLHALEPGREGRRAASGGFHPTNHAGPLRTPAPALADPMLDAQTVDARVAVASMDAATVDGRPASMDAVTLDARAAAVTVTAPPSAAQPTPATPLRRWLPTTLAGLLVAALAGGAGSWLRREAPGAPDTVLVPPAALSVAVTSGPASVAPVPVAATPAPDPVAAPAPDPVAAPAPDPVAAPAPDPVAAPMPPPPIEARRPARPPPAASPTLLPPETAAELDRAEAELRAGRSGDALRLGQHVLLTAKSPQVWSLLARARCKEGDIGAARPFWSKLAGAERARVKQACAADGVTF